jgi:hypothetical protein
VKAAVDVAPIRAEYERVARCDTDAARRALYAAEFSGDAPPRRLQPADAAALVTALDARGAWVTDVMVHVPVAVGKHPGDTAPVRGISSAVFARNLSALAAFIAGGTR